ncbi:hypothetical protein TNCV_790651 [Trichonephila clavipes]|nr:hypothetical protein TNCV_790651 [Trichonephila clavipes]
MKNSSEGIDSETLYSVKLFMDVGFQGNLRKSQLYFKLPPDRSSYLRMINAKKKERFLPGPGTIVLRQKDTNLVTGKPFRIKTCCSSQMLINSLREDTEYLLDLGVNGMGESNRTLPVVWLGRVNRYPYPRIKCIKYGNLNQVTRAESSEIRSFRYSIWHLYPQENDVRVSMCTLLFLQIDGPSFRGVGAVCIAVHRRYSHFFPRVERSCKAYRHSFRKIEKGGA